MMFETVASSPKEGPGGSTPEAFPWESNVDKEEAFDDDEVVFSDGHTNLCGEEECCPAFWFDRGVPDVPIPILGHVLYWIFDPTNVYLNDNTKMRTFGSLGLKWVDRRRKPLFLIAILFTVVAMFVTAFGCAGLSTDTKTVESSYWGYCSFKARVNSTLNGTSLGDDPSEDEEIHGVDVFLGLSAVVARRCVVTEVDSAGTTGATIKERRWEHCHVSPESGSWGHVSCHSADGGADDGGGNNDLADGTLLGFNCEDIDRWVGG